MLFIFPSRYLFAIGLSPIFSFRWNLPPILSCIPKQLDSSKEFHMSVGTWPHTGFSPSMTSCSKELRPDHARNILYKLQLGPWGQISNLSCYRFTRRYWGNPCWFLFLRLLICLSSAGIPTWSEVNLKKLGVAGKHTPGSPKREELLRLKPNGTATDFKACRKPAGPNTKQSLRVVMTLEQACPPEYQRAQCAFKDSMIHWILQFTLLIAFRCVLHRCQNQEIRCWKF